MSVSRDIVQSWRRPLAVYRRLLDMGPREDRAIAYLMAACLLVFVAQWPRLVRLSQGLDLPVGAEAPALDRLLAYELMGWLMIWPLAFYLLAWVVFLVCRLIGLQVRSLVINGYESRLALFWALLAATPAMLLFGLLRGLNGDVSGTRAIGVVWVAAVLVFWLSGLWAAHQHRSAKV